VTPTWEQRWHPLREEWVVVAAHRQHRPWTGGTVAAPPAAARPAYDPECYLCPGNARVGGARNPRYDGTFVFDNDHPCVGPAAPRTPVEPPAPYRVAPADGQARVVCFSPRHDLTLAEMSDAAIGGVVEVWRRETRDLGARPDVKQVLCFENKGEVVGVSNPHPHGQIYATRFVWKTMETELAASARHRAETGRGLMDDVIRAEQAGGGPRVIHEDEHMIAFVPYFARYAYEVYLVAKRRVPHVFALNDAEGAALARALSAVTIRFDNLWRTSFPYVMVLHQAPSDAGADAFHFFIAFHPPLRQPHLLKYLAGPEIGGGNFLSDTSPETSAAELRALPAVHHAAAAATR